MSSLQFILGGNPNLPPPTEWQKLELQLNWDLDHPAASLSTSKFTFEGASAHYLNDRIAQGVNGGEGIFVGADYQIIDCNNITALEGCVDTAAAESVYRCDRVEAPVKDTRIKDYLTDNWDGFSFAYLNSLTGNSPGRILSSDFIDIPYTVSTIPNYSQLLSTGLAIFCIEREVEDVIRSIGDLTGTTAQPTTTLLGVVEIIIYLIYLAAIIIALIKLVQLFIAYIFQTPKYKKGMYVRTLCQRAAAYLGITFSSTILNNPSSTYYRAAVIPKKIQQYNPNTFLSFKRPVNEQGSSTAYGYYEGTFGDFAKQLENIFNARFRLLNGIMYFERQDSFNNQSAFQLPNIDLFGLNNGSYRYNCSELASNYFATWKLDSTELNTYDDFGGTNAQMMATCTHIANPYNNLLRGLTSIEFEFALGKRKDHLIDVEKVLNNIIGAIFGFSNTITSLINSIGNINIPQLPTGILNNRVGWLLASTDYFNEPKFVVLDSSNKIASNNRTLTSVEYLFNNYHYVNFPLTNQWIIYEGWEIPFCCADYVKLLDNNEIKTFDNRIGKITNLRWQIGTEIATIDFKVRPPNNRYTNNITQLIMADNG